MNRVMWQLVLQFQSQIFIDSMNVLCRLSSQQEISVVCPDLRTLYLDLLGCILSACNGRLATRIGAECSNT